jgi:hypothetical protein
VKLASHNFVKRLRGLFAEELQTDGSSPGTRSPHHTQYLGAVFSAAMELVTICDRLELPIAFLTEYGRRSENERAGTKMFDQLLYHLENHLIRTTSSLDRSLILVNEVFLLGNERCTYLVVTTNRHIDGSPVRASLKKLRAFLEPSRRPRNSVVHVARLKSVDLREVEALHLLEEAGQNPLAGPKTNALKGEFAVRKRKELVNFNTRLLKLVGILLEQLEPEFGARYALLRDSCGGDSIAPRDVHR